MVVDAVVAVPMDTQPGDVVAEGPASTRPEHMEVVGQALGLPDVRSHTLLLDSAEWTAMPRRRFFLSVLPVIFGDIR